MSWWPLRFEVWKLRCRSVPVEEIAAQFGISVERVNKLTQDELKFIEVYERNRREDERDLFISAKTKKSYFHLIASTWAFPKNKGAEKPVPVVVAVKPLL